MLRAGFLERLKIQSLKNINCRADIRSPFSVFFAFSVLALSENLFVIPKLFYYYYELLLTLFAKMIRLLCLCNIYRSRPYRFVL